VTKGDERKGGGGKFTYEYIERTGGRGRNEGRKEGNPALQRIPPTQQQCLEGGLVRKGDLGFGKGKNSRC